MVRKERMKSNGEVVINDPSTKVSQQAVTTYPGVITKGNFHYHADGIQLPTEGLDPTGNLEPYIERCLAEKIMPFSVLRIHYGVNSANDFQAPLYEESALWQHPPSIRSSQIVDSLRRSLKGGRFALVHILFDDKRKDHEEGQVDFREQQSQYLLENGYELGKVNIKFKNRGDRLVLRQSPDLAGEPAGTVLSLADQYGRTKRRWNQYVQWFESLKTSTTTP